jgi:hypothetical protein
MAVRPAASGGSGLSDDYSKEAAAALDELF